MSGSTLDRTTTSHDTPAMRDLADQQGALLRRLRAIPAERMTAQLEQLEQLSNEERECIAELAEVEALIAAGDSRVEFAISLARLGRSAGEARYGGR